MRIRTVIIVLLVALLVHGCSWSLLPKSTRVTRSPWKSFDEVNRDFDRIVPYKSTVEDLRQLRFDPFETPNVGILTYLDVMNRFLMNPSVSKEDLAQGVQDCLESREVCRAYEIDLKLIDKKRYGNVLLDLLNFRRNTNESGWEFNALIVIKGDLVVYKMSGGKPNLEIREERKNPLGPLQEPEGFFLDVISN